MFGMLTRQSRSQASINQAGTGKHLDHDSEVFIRFNIFLIKPRCYPRSSF